jgi:hypothetical protein
MVVVVDVDVVDVVDVDVVVETDSAVVLTDATDVVGGSASGPALAVNNSVVVVTSVAGRRWSTPATGTATSGPDAHDAAHAAITTARPSRRCVRVLVWIRRFMVKALIDRFDRRHESGAPESPVVVRLLLGQDL